jgi:hypothetical protein
MSVTTIPFNAQDRTTAILTTARRWTGSPATGPHSMVVHVLLPGAPTYETFNDMSPDSGILAHFDWI